MKYTILLMSFAFVFFLATSCKKSNTTESNKSYGLTGSWELRLVEGSMPPKNFAVDNGNIIQFTNDRYKVFDSSRLKEEGNYTTTPDTSVVANVCLLVKEGEFTNRINFSATPNPNKVFYNIEGNQLTFLTGCFAIDGGSRTVYERVEK